MIFLAQDVETQEVFALKKMTCMDAETVKEAVREIELYNLFDHPNIIKCVDSHVATSPSDQGAKDVYMLLPLYRVCRLPVFPPALRGEGFCTDCGAATCVREEHFRTLLRRIRSMGFDSRRPRFGKLQRGLSRRFLPCTPTSRRGLPKSVPWPTG